MNIWHYRNGLELKRARGTPVIDSVVVENESRLSPRGHRGDDYAIRRAGRSTLRQLESDIANNIYGFDTFETVTYDVDSDSGDNDAYCKRATEKSWGPNYLRFGINLEDDFDGDSNYNVAARFTRTEINKKGGEIRAEIQIGESPRLFAELYQPLDFASRWFVNPQIEFQRSNSGLFDDGLQLAQFRSSESTISLEGGREFGNWGEFRIGLTRTHSNAAVRIGTPGIGSGSADLAGLSARFAYDTIDRFAIPKSGTNISLGWSGFRDGLGSDATLDLAGLFFLKAQTWNNHTVLHWWDLVSTTKDQTDGVAPFSLGGLFSLSGYAADELSGKHSGIGRLLYYYRLGDQALPVLDTSIYFGASIEAGNVWQDSNEIGLDNTLFAGSVFVVFDTLLGPLYVAYGAGEGGRRSAYLFLGQTF